ncbi:hypothetical protein [Geomicrobium sp. JCM 19055]|uniref:hypothetical protein n=1 Tax=Geomicrobium sp. JCM 19055 TaxID=1460649 RepID=UPI001267C284|nr:hypothetical protein [Geomicrobium sp. JCM 19055]
MVGDRHGEEIEAGFNYASRGNGHPGSTVKPFMDFGPAIEEHGWGTGQTLVDEPMNILVVNRLRTLLETIVVK